MAGKSRGRGVTAAVAWLLLCGGVIGAIALVIVGERRFDNTVETFARANVGCATTLRFTDPGTFYVYEETGTSPAATDASGTPADVETCVPASQPGTEFSFSLTAGEGPVRTVRDRSITYQRDGRSGASYSSFEVAAPVTVDIVVSGPDITTVAAVGRNPVQARDEMRRTAAILGVAGVVLGALLLVLSGRKSRRAWVMTLPEGPGWSRPIPAAPPVTWPPAGPSIDGIVSTTSQQPINPHMPDRPVGSVAPGEPWPSPTHVLMLPPTADPLPRRLPAPKFDPPMMPTAPNIEPVDQASDRPSETPHDRDDATED
jgi:hypothetical protein